MVKLHSTALERGEKIQNAFNKKAFLSQRFKQKTESFTWFFSFYSRFLLYIAGHCFFRKQSKNCWRSLNNRCFCFLRCSERATNHRLALGDFWDLQSLLGVLSHWPRDLREMWWCLWSQGRPSQKRRGKGPFRGWAVFGFEQSFFWYGFLVFGKRFKWWFVEISCESLNFSHWFVTYFGPPMYSWPCCG